MDSKILKKNCYYMGINSKHINVEKVVRTFYVLHKISGSQNVIIIVIIWE